MNYANAKNIPLVALVGENEMKQGQVTIKDMNTGEQKSMPKEELITYIKA